MFNEKTNKLCISILFAVILFSGSIPNAQNIPSQEKEQDQYLKKIDSPEVITPEQGDWILKLAGGYTGVPNKQQMAWAQEQAFVAKKWRGDTYETVQFGENNFTTKIGLPRFVENNNGVFVPQLNYGDTEGVESESGITSVYFDTDDSCTFSIYDHGRIEANETPILKSDSWLVKYAESGSDDWNLVEQNSLPCTRVWSSDSSGLHLKLTKYDSNGIITQEYEIPKIITNAQFANSGIHQKISYTNKNPERTNHKFGFSNILSDVPDHISIVLSNPTDPTKSDTALFSTVSELPVSFSQSITQYVGNEFNIPRERLLYANGLPTTNNIQFHFLDPKADNLFYRFDHAFDKLWNIRIKNMGNHTDLYLDYMNTEEITPIGGTTSIDPIFAQSYFANRSINSGTLAASRQCSLPADGNEFITQDAVGVWDTSFPTGAPSHCQIPFFQYNIAAIPDNAQPSKIIIATNQTKGDTHVASSCSTFTFLITEWRGEDITTLNAATFWNMTLDFTGALNWAYSTTPCTATPTLLNDTFIAPTYQTVLDFFEAKLETGNNVLTLSHCWIGCAGDLSHASGTAFIILDLPQYIEVTYSVFNPPSAPQNLTCVATSTTNIHLDWDAPADTGGTVIDNHNILRSTGGGFQNLTNTGSALSFYDDPTVFSGVQFQYKVAAINNAGLGTYTAPISCGVQVRPDPPTNLTVSNVALNQVVLDWLAPAFNGNTPITGYRIERNNGTGFLNVTANTGNTLVEYFDNTVATRTQYAYRVSAINAIGAGDPSNPFVLTTIGTSDPPTNAQATPTSTSTITVTWSAPSNSGGTSITGYKIDRAIGDLINQARNNGFTGSTNTFTANKTYAMKFTSLPNISNVSAVSVTCISSCSGNLKVSVYSDSNGNPSSLLSESASTPIAVGINNLTLNTIVHVPTTQTLWFGTLTNLNTNLDSGVCASGLGQFATAIFPNFNSTYGTGTSTTTCRYTSITLDGGGFFPYITNTGNAQTSFSDVLLTPNTLHSYIIFTRTIAGVSALSSNIARATTFDAPSAPTNLSAIAPTGSTITLSWTTPTSNGGSPIIGYKIERKTTGDFSTLVGNTGTAQTTYTDTGLAISTTFTYRVSAINQFGTGAVSNEASATTPATPHPPVNLVAQGQSATDILLTWQAGQTFSPIIGYKIERKPFGGTFSTLVANTGTTLTTYLDTGLPVEAIFVYRVSAITSGEGTSAPSNEATGRTFSAPDFPPENLQGTFPEFPPYQINMTWIEPETFGGLEVTYYRIQRDTGFGFENYANVTSTSFTDENLDNSTEHKYRIFTDNPEGESGTYSVAIPSDANQVSHWHFENTLDDTGINQNSAMDSGQADFTTVGAHNGFGFGFHNTMFANSTHEFLDNNTGSFTDKIWAEKFTGLPVGQTITQITLNTFNAPAGSAVRGKIYQDDGGSVLTPQTNNYNQSGTSSGWAGFIWAEKFTGLPVGHHVLEVAYSTDSVFGSARAKVYQDDGVGGLPSTLLDESASVFAGSCCVVNATIPASGNVWIGFEFTSNSLKLLHSTGQPNGTMVFVAHTYGTGASPFGTATGSTDPLYMQLSYDADFAGYPSTLLDESASTPVCCTLQNIPMNATIPASGNVWVGIESNSVSQRFYHSEFQPSGTAISHTHVYGTGSSPFGLARNETDALWMQIFYNTTGNKITVDPAQESDYDFNTATPFSMSTWYSGLGGGDQVLMAKANSMTSIGYKFIISGTKPVLILTNTDSTNEIKVRAESVVTDGFVHFLAFTYNGNGTASGVTITVDGSEPSLTILTNNLSGSILNNEPLTFGATSGQANTLSAVLDDIRVYQRALTTINSQVDEIFNENFETTAPLNATISLDGSTVANISGELVRINLISGFPPPDVGTILLKNFTTTTVNSVTPAVTIDPITGRFVFDRFYNIYFSTSNYTATTMLDNGIDTFPLVSNFDVQNIQFILNENIFFSHERRNNFSILFYNITRTIFPFDLQCNIKFELFGNGTTYNFTQVGFVQTNVTVPFNRNAYVACIDPNIPPIDPNSPSFGGSNSLISFVSYGDTSGIGSFLTFTANYGNFFGVSLPFLFIIILAALFTGRSAPTGIIIVAVAIGIMWYIGIFTLQPFMWAVVLLLAVLGALGGKRFF